MLIRDSARRLARYRWAEGRVFEAAGSLAASAPDADAAITLEAISRHAGWRSQQWDVLVPVLHDVDADELGPKPELVAAFDGLDLGSLVSLALPALEGWYESHLGLTSAVADAPVARMLRLLLVDVQDDRRAAVLLSSRLLEGAALDQVTAHRSTLSRLLLTIGD